jgi:CheY-like chemotaxis protein
MADLAGLRVLVVEDEGAVALLIEDMLLDLGCEVAASVAQLDRACELASTVAIDFALLDLNLDGASALPVAHILRRRRIPFIFSTGYGRHGVVEEFKSYPLLAKPFVMRDLQEKISMALARHPEQPTTVERSRPL